MIKGILFDLDGTLFYTLIDLMNAVNYAMDSLGYPRRNIDDIRRFIGNGINKLVERSLPSNHLDDLDKALILFKNHYDIHSADNITIYCGIIDLLLELKISGIKMAVVTNKDDDNAKYLVKLVFNDLFDEIVGATKDVPKKPNSSMCNIALNKLDLSNEEVLYIGDTDVDYETAINSNIKPVLCSWGYRDKELLLSLTKDVIDKPMELLKYIK